MYSIIVAYVWGNERILVSINWSASIANWVMVTLVCENMIAITVTIDTPLYIFHSRCVYTSIRLSLRRNRGAVICRNKAKTTAVRILLLASRFPSNSFHTGYWVFERLENAISYCCNLSFRRRKKSFVFAIY